MFHCCLLQFFGGLEKNVKQQLCLDLMFVKSSTYLNVMIYNVEKRFVKEDHRESFKNNF